MKIDEFKDALNQLAYTATNTRSGIISVYTHNYWGEDDANGWCFRLAPARKTVIVGKQWDKLDGMPVFCVRDLLNLIAELEKTPVKERFPEKKYTIQVIANDNSAYLNCYKENNRMAFYDDIETDHVKTRFTQSEIDKLKQRPDLAIDWNKAIIKEAKDDED